MCLVTVLFAVVAVIVVFVVVGGGVIKIIFVSLKSPLRPPTSALTETVSLADALKLHLPYFINLVPLIKGHLIIPHCIKYRTIARFNFCPGYIQAVHIKVSR